MRLWPFVVAALVPVVPAAAQQTAEPPACVRVEAGFRGTIRGHAEWWDVRLLRDGRAWIVSALTLALIT